MLYILLWYFIIYAFLGWCCEVAFAGIVENRFVNRGFLNGAVCPIYGFGICIVYCCLMPVKDTWISLFLLSTILTTLLELATGFALDKLFHQRWWDYSGNKFNLGGYVCLIASIGWGVGCLFVVKVLFPMTDELIHLIPKQAGIMILALVYVIFAADTVITICTMIGLNKYIRQLDEMSKAIREDSDKIGTQVSKGAIVVKKQYDEKLKDKYEDLTERGEKVKNELLEKGSYVKSEIVEKGGLVKNELAEKGRELMDSLSHKKSRSEIKEMYNKAIEKGLAKYKRYLNAFPNLKFEKYPEQINTLKERMRKKH